ncbi:MAG: hypothetical protein QOC70_2533 [Verrucomicrobiota bacterium]
MLSVCRCKSPRGPEPAEGRWLLFSEINGLYNSDTATAVTRYQIRNGLQITGKVDAQTRHALGVAAAGESEVPLPKLGEDVWRYLRKSDQAYISRLMAEDAKVSKPRKSPANSTLASAPTVAIPPTTARKLSNSYDRERLRDYVAAFVLAGLDPQVGAEAEFFADRVDYFGEHHVTREKIRRDLQRYDKRWPERGFWLAGDLAVRPVKDKLEVSFPLRYELRSGSRRSSGQVWKTLILERTGADDLQIVSVNERKAR